VNRFAEFTFEEWVEYLFEHEFPEYGFDHPVNWFDYGEHPGELIWNDLEKPGETVAYMTRLFENATEVLKPYSDLQIANGLWFLINDMANAPASEMVSKGQRVALAKSIYVLFEQIFGPRCDARLGHSLTTQDDVNPLNTVCYMWWDIFFFPAPDDKYKLETMHEVLRVMQKTLALDSIACQEAGLHGLGHWWQGGQEMVETIIDGYLKANKGRLSVELEAYAISARGGCVL